MSRIAILPEALANQIAAGEVVERPASVVKELLENALDAGASQVVVQVEGAGTRLIRVIDNGCGMDQDDLLLCLERHATSKLRQADDLNHLTTLGFRGEAIPSVASVARLSVTSRPQGAELGGRIEVRFGTVLKVHDMGCAQGTVVEVADLFANVPARRKFLKSAQTELAHIDEVVRSYALINCRTGFSYQVGGREVFDLPASVDSEERRVRQIFGDAAELIRVATSAEADRAEIQVRGFLLPPEQGGGRIGRLWTFVNGRYIKDRMVNHAVAEGMQGFLPRGGRAAGVVQVHLPAEAVDVNVHPTKQEVRFREANLVHNKIVAAIWRSMEDYQERLKGKIFGPPRPVTVAAPPVLAQPTPPAPPRASWPLARPAGDQEAAVEVRETRPAPLALCPTPLFAGPGETTPSPLPGPVEEVSRPAPAPVATPAPTAPPAEEEGDSLRYIGQLFDAYLLCQSADGLVAIDQHAVQERLIFEDLKAHYRRASMPGQVLMFPEMVELLPAEVEAVAQHQEDLSRLGLDLQEFGGDTLLIKAVPAALAHLPAAEVLRGILRRYVEDPMPGGEGARLEEILAGMACKSAIKAGHRLTALEVEHLLKRMRRAGIFSHCPHGRSVLKRFSRQEIDRWFQRT